jgi:hypothetical protein
MNGLSIESLSALDPATALEVERRSAAWRMGGLGRGLARLDPETRLEVARRAVSWGVAEALGEAAARHGPRLAGMGQDAMTAVIGPAVERALTPLLPALGAQLVKVVEPAARKAADVVGPAVEEKLRAHGPRLAIIAGVVAAILGLLGMAALGWFVARRVA